MFLNRGQIANFQLFNGEIIRGKVFIVHREHYVVSVPGRACGQYPDGMFRIPKDMVVGEDNVSTLCKAA